jgi:asparagine synthase (glutamine-hydrolysing)
MKHRGPDDEGVFYEGNLGLGFVRLSILDLTRAGNQPMITDDGRYVIVYNGEIFNYIELRDDLIKKGYHFRTRSDTEVLLASFSEWGEKCLDRLNGMWAFGIYDRVNKSLFASRDRYGIKPFYYCCDDQSFIFSSEINSILSVLKSKPWINEQAVFDFLVFNRTDHNENTFFRGIKKLPHGSAAWIKDQGFKVKKWYELENAVSDAGGFHSPEEFLSLLTDSIGLRLRSDVPVGVCLSGGLDSSSIVSLLTGRFNLSEINTFSAIYEKGQMGDESGFIREYKETVRNMHYTTPDAASLAGDLSDFIKIHAEPVPDTGVYAQYKVMSLACKNVVVTLDGQGADEILGGYHYFFGIFFKDLARQLRFYKLGSEVRHYLLNHHSLYGLKTMGYYMLPNSLKTQTRVFEKAYLRRDFLEEHKNQSTLPADLYSSHSLKDSLIDHFEHKLEHLLKWEDLNSMRFSVEARVPFLDHRLVAKTIASSGEMMINKGMTKSIMREALKGIVPETIRLRKDKVGFGTPRDQWFRDPRFNTLIEDVISSGSYISRNYISSSDARKLYTRYVNGKIDISKEIWKWINLELWCRRVNS